MTHYNQIQHGKGFLAVLSFTCFYSLENSIHEIEETNKWETDFAAISHGKTSGVVTDIQNKRRYAS